MVAINNLWDIDSFLRKIVLSLAQSSTNPFPKILMKLLVSTAALASVNTMLEIMARYSQNITNNTSKTINNYSNSFALSNPYYSMEQIANYVIKKIGG